MTPDPITLELPWPCSINHYYVTVNVRGRLMRIIGKEGKAYQEAVSRILFLRDSPRIDGECCIDRLILHPPTKGRRDIDNVLKCLWDSLQDRKDRKTGVPIPGLFRDDCQIKKYHCIEWGCVVPNGRVNLQVSQIPLALFAGDTDDE